MKRVLWPPVAMMLCGLLMTGCGGSAGVLRGDGFTATLPDGWRAAAPQSEQGGTMYSSSGPNNEQIEVLVIPFNAPLFAGLDAGSADLATLLEAIGSQNGTTPVDVAPPSWTTVRGNPAMQFNATLLESDGTTKTQAETIDTRYGTDLYYIFYGGNQNDFADADSAARAMLATWKWIARPAAAGAAPAGVPVFATGLFSFSSPPGDYIGQGQRQQYLTPSDTFSLFSYGDKPDLSAGFRVHVSSPDGVGWDVTVAPPSGQLLHTGSYGSATRALGPGPDAGLDVTGESRGCNRLFGSFTIAEIATDAHGVIKSLDMTFTQRCEQATAPALSGHLHVAR